MQLCPHRKGPERRPLRLWSVCCGDILGLAVSIILLTMKSSQVPGVRNGFSIAPTSPEQCLTNEKVKLRKRVHHQIRETTACPLFLNTNKILIKATEYYSVIKQEEILPCTTAWMNLEDVTLSEKPEQRRTNTAPPHSCGI